MLSSNTEDHEIKDFASDVIERSQTIPVVVDFWATWCGPCRVLTPVLEKLEKEQAGKWVLAKVDTDRNEEIAARYGVRGIPSVKMFVDGEVKDEFVGALPENAVAGWLRRALPDPSKKELDAAEQLIASGEAETARQKLNAVLTADPKNERAQVLLSRFELFSDPGKAIQLIGGIEPGSEQHDMAEAVGTIAALLLSGNDASGLPEDPVRSVYLASIQKLAGRDFDGAVEGFINVIRTSRGYDDDGARKACIAIFRYLGENHEVTLRHRRAFGSALNV